MGTSTRENSINILITKNKTMILSRSTPSLLPCLSSFPSIKLLGEDGDFVTLPMLPLLALSSVLRQQLDTVCQHSWGEVTISLPYVSGPSLVSLRSLLTTGSTEPLPENAQ